MREKNRYLKYINFTPYKLKVFKSENFSLQTTPVLSKNKSSYTNINKNRENIPTLNKNPTQNYLFDKINISNLSTSKLLLNKSIKISKSVDYNNKDGSNKRGKNRHINKNDSLKNIYNNNYYCIYKNRTKTPIKNYITNNNDIIIPSELYHLNSYFKLNNKKPKVIYVQSNGHKYGNRNKYNFEIYNNEKVNAEQKEKLKKIIFIQSFWRSFFLRKLVVGGLEKYYSSIAMGKYLLNIFHKNKQSLFKYFIEILKEYIIQKRYSCFKYKKNNNNINIFFKGNDDSNGSFEIPNDKKNDCIYFFIKREQAKSNNKITKNDKINNMNKKNKINIKDYNSKYYQKSRNNKKKTPLYHKKSKYNIKKDNYKNKINIKINLINHHNNDNNEKNKQKLASNIANNYPKLVDKNKNIINLKLNENNQNQSQNQIKHKKIYIKKKVGEDSNNNSKIRINKILASFKKEKNKNKNNKNEINFKKLNSFINILKRQISHIYYRLFIERINNKEKNIYLLKLIQILNKIIIQKYFNIFKNNNINSIINNKINNNTNTKLHSIFPIRNITYYKKNNNKHNHIKVKNKSLISGQNHQIKVNKNNGIEKIRKLKLLKKIIEKKSNNNNILTKYFLIWKNSYKLVYINFSCNQNLDNKIGRDENVNRYKSENVGKKKHIKIKYKKSFTTNIKDMARSNSYEKTNVLSMSSKKMKVSKLFYDKSNFYSTISSSQISHCKSNFFNRIVKDENKFYNKVISLIKKIENKNIIYKYFINWKKESKKNKADN